jgi:hypothetical protein
MEVVLGEVIDDVVGKVVGQQFSLIPLPSPEPNSASQGTHGARLEVVADVITIEVVVGEVVGEVLVGIVGQQFSELPLPSPAPTSSQGMQVVEVGEVVGEDVVVIDVVRSVVVIDVVSIEVVGGVVGQQLSEFSLPSPDPTSSSQGIQGLVVENVVVIDVVGSVVVTDVVVIEVEVVEEVLVGTVGQQFSDFPLLSPDPTSSSQGTQGVVVEDVVVIDVVGSVVVADVVVIEVVVAEVVDKVVGGMVGQQLSELPLPSPNPSSPDPSQRTHPTVVLIISVVVSVVLSRNGYSVKISSVTSSVVSFQA